MSWFWFLVCLIKPATGPRVKLVLPVSCVELRVLRFWYCTRFLSEVLCYHFLLLFLIAAFGNTCTSFLGMSSWIPQIHT
ncbi:hypothetical protein L1987_20227 [Smallanthus sonchifolius]|uniref:Uncharacterized protein n=1 Tax=Smallanthus sonchifolius TaxID=185202 RepID=A0ACB9IS06_9ASTR|nr:hypothetical protein L1987_20227 [Smallanthus sonchifolius]